MKKVIVLMATYNGEKYLDEQLESIINQKNVETEILVRDDGSTDNTIDILKKYEKSGKINWYKGEHLNVAKGFMELVKKAPLGDYYAFCDQDDVWLENKLNSAVSLLEKESNQIPLMYYSATTLVDEKLRFISEHIIHEKRSDMARFIFNDMSGNTIVFNNILRSYLMQNDDLNITIHDKWTLQLCLALGGKCLGDKNSYILYRQHGNNTIGMELSLKDKIKKFKRIVNCPNDIHLRFLNEKYKDNIVFPYSKILSKIKEDEKMSFIDRCRIAFDKDISFSNSFFQLAYILHVFKGNL